METFGNITLHLGDCMDVHYYNAARERILTNQKISKTILIITTMTEEQITALFREYAKLHDGTSADKAYIKAIAESVIRFLLRRYCLVEKAKVVELYQTNRQREWRQRMPTSTAVVLALESLFPELAKEVES